jgi:hypothetical protein
LLTTVAIALRANLMALPAVCAAMDCAAAHIMNVDDNDSHL